MKKTIVLLSGGIDSMVCAEQARRFGTLAGCVFVDYGHPAQVQEGWKAFAYCGSRNVPLKVVHAFGLNLGDMGTEAGARVVPNRNAVLLSIAANQARAMGGNDLVFGAISADQRDYEDCRPAFIVGMSNVLGMTVRAPLIGYTKAEVLAMARELDLKPDDSWSCYGPGPTPCGTCPSCVEREKAAGELCPST